MPHEVLMVRLSKGMDAGRIVEWLKSEGDEVIEGEPLLLIESDKTEVEVPAPASGVLRRILVTVGSEAVVGSVLGIIAGIDETISDLPQMSAAAAPRPSAAQGPESVPNTTARPVEKVRHAASPAARRAARELGIHLESVAGSGVDGLISETDVRAAAATLATAADVIPMSAIRLRIAQRMVESRRTAADVTTVTDVDMSEIAHLRDVSGFSYVAYVAAASAQALREYPVVNSSLVGDEIRIWRNVHLGIAVATDQGLVVPVIRDADTKSIETIAGEVDQLAGWVRAGTASADLLRGSTFTVTNSGSLGSLFFTPIINLPEVAVLGMGKVADTPVVRDGQVAIAKVMYLCLSYDHRVIDGATAVRFLQSIKQRLETPLGEFS